MDFLNYENLQNRYDHFALAGTSLLCTDNLKNYLNDSGLKYSEAWTKTMDDHITIAKDLHHIEDIYIVEHQDCGAYKAFINVDISNLSLNEEIEMHKQFATELANKLRNKFGINAHCFFIDLRGNVENLYSTYSDDKHA